MKQTERNKKGIYEMPYAEIIGIDEKDVIQTSYHSENQGEWEKQE